MNVALTQEERLREADEAVEAVKQQLIADGFIRAVEELAQSDAVDPAFAERLAEISERLGALPGKLEPAAFDSEQMRDVLVALHETKDLMQGLEHQEGGRLDTLNQALIRVERVRHIVRDALDEHVSGIRNDQGQVVDQLIEWLPGVAQHEIARLVDVAPRTLSRWRQQPGPPQRRLQVVAQLIAILRHSWTPEGVVAWFGRPNHELGNRKPLSLVDQAGRERDLLMAARATRSQYGT